MITGKFARLALPLLLALASATACGAAPGHSVSMWSVAGATNRVYLLGSVHLLRSEDYPLPSVIYDAYADAETLVMEMDMDDLDPFEAQRIVRELGMLTDGRTLKDLMDAEDYARAEELAARADVPLQVVSASEPWLAAITIEQLVLARMGFDPDYGVESHLTARAVSDNKVIEGLETVREQLEFLDNMSLEAQQSLLLQALEDSIELEQLMDDLILAWRRGDVAFIEENMLLAARDEKELYETVVVKRNRNWVERLDTLLADDDDYLVVVGVLHLIGEDGIPAMLARRGFEVTQMREAGVD